MSKKPPDFLNAVIEGDLISEVFPAVPRDLSENLDRLSQYVREETQRPIVISGPLRSGKTTLVNQFVQHHLPPRIRLEWFDVEDTRNLSATIDALIGSMRGSESPEGLLVVMDNTERVRPSRLQELIHQLFNWKKVKSIIVTRSSEIDLQRAHVINLAPRDGKLYGLREQLVTPQREIISIVAPQIVRVNDTLIEKLKRSPDDLFEITPRQFEEVIADLLEGMGMDVELTPATRDGGKDILAYMNTELGRFLTLVETKRHNKSRAVGVSLVRTLYGTLLDHQATSGMLVTTSRFAKPAKAFQERHKYQLSLKDYQDVVSWILKYKT